MPIDVKLQVFLRSKMHLLIVLGVSPCRFDLLQSLRMSQMMHGKLTFSDASGI